MERIVRILGLTGIVLILGFGKIFAGAPWGEVLPKGRSWFKLYYVATWASKKFDEKSNKRSIVSGYETDARESVPALEYAYGLTDDLSVGTIIPYTYRSNKLDPKLIPDQEADGMGDIKIGGQYRYYKSDILALACRITAKLPNGKVDDPDDSGDITIGSGQAYIELTNYLDYYMLEKTWVLSGMVRFNLQLEGEYDAAQSQKALLGDTYKKDPGDDLWIAAGIERRNIIIPGLSSSVRLEERFDSKDDYSSNSQSYDESKEANTSGQLLFIQPEIKYSAYTTYKIPIRVYSNYRMPISGKNNYAFRRLEAGVDIFF